MVPRNQYPRHHTTTDRAGRLRGLAAAIDQRTVAGMKLPSAQEKRAIIEHLEHEVAQFLGAVAQFTGVLQMRRDDPARIKRTAFFEVVLLHARLLDEFLGTEPTHPDDLWTGSFTTNWTKASPLDTVAPVSPGGRSVRTSINNQLAHPSGRP